MSFTGVKLGPSIVLDGIVLYLDAANRNSYSGSGTVFTDLSRQQNTGTLVGAGATFNSGNIGNIALNGSSGYITCGNPSSLAFLNRDPFTLQVTFKYKSFAADVYPGIIARTNVSNRSGYYLSVLPTAYSGGGVGFERFRNGVGASGIYHLGVIPNNSICILTATYDGTNMVLYSNGQNVASTTSTFNTTNDTNFYIGVTQTTYFLNTNIYNVCVYNRALTENEALQNFNAIKQRFGL
jgi:hypothetical protein